VEGRKEEGSTIKNNNNERKKRKEKRSPHSPTKKEGDQFSVR
jgi:hypothetical protein